MLMTAHTETFLLANRCHDVPCCYTTTYDYLIIVKNESLMFYIEGVDEDKDKGQET